MLRPLNPWRSIQLNNIAWQMLCSCRRSLAVIPAQSIDVRKRLQHRKAHLAMALPRCARC